jgi:hypothetical protein
MTKSAIRDILYGYRGHHETIKVPRGEEYQRNIEILSDTYDELREKLSVEVFKVLERFTTAKDDIQCEESGCYFTEGFKLGILVGIECGEGREYGDE